MTLPEAANCATEILNGTTDFENRKIIRRVFHKDSDIVLRLAVIDSFYSTNMSKRIGGIQAIASSIRNTYGNDNQLKQIVTGYLDGNNNEEIHSLLFDKKFGIHRNGADAGKATSLLSKYFYFLLEGKFPICDGNVEIVYKKIRKAKAALNLGFDLNTWRNREDYVQLLKNLNTESEIDDFCKLDNLLWVTGKFIKGSVHSCMGWDQYKRLANYLNLNVTNDIDGTIRNFIEGNETENQLQNVFGEQIARFIIQFVKKLD